MIYLSGHIRADLLGLRRDLGVLLTPRMGNDPDLSATTWAADTGCFTKPDAFSLDGYLGFLRARSRWLSNCLFATAPDVVGDALATWERSRAILPILRDTGVPAALVAQDGIEKTSVISQFALRLNDSMPDDERQRLLPYVTRLAGTADVSAIEGQRAAYLAMQAVNVFAPRALDAANLRTEADRCRRAKSLREAAEAMAAITMVSIDMLIHSAGSAELAVIYTIDYEYKNAAKSAAAAASFAEAWDDAIAALDGVLAIGQQADSIDVGLAVDRLEHAKAKEIA